MSDNGEGTGLVAELRERSRMFGDGYDITEYDQGVAKGYSSAADIAAPYEQQWQAKEKALRDLVEEWRRKGEDETPCDHYHAGYKFARKTAAAEIDAILDGKQ